MERFIFSNLVILLTVISCTSAQDRIVPPLSPPDVTSLSASNGTGNVTETEVLHQNQDACQQEKLLELVFLIDRSSHTVLKEMPRLIQLTEDLVKDYPGAKFGINYYADFICSDWVGPNDEHCNQEIMAGLSYQEACYTFYKQLSNDIPSLKKNVEQGAITYYMSGYYESGLAAVMMTAADKKVGWTPQGKKVIVVVTDDGTHNWPKKSGGQDLPKGDGTDTCQFTQNPTANYTGQILRDNDISLFLLLATGGSVVNTFEQWTEVAETMDVKYDLAYMNYPNSVILRKIKGFLSRERNFEILRKIKSLADASNSGGAYNA